MQMCMLFRGTVLSLRGEYNSAIDDFESGLESEGLNGRDGESYAFAQFVEAIVRQPKPAYPSHFWFHAQGQHRYVCCLPKWRCIGIVMIVRWLIVLRVRWRQRFHVLLKTHLAAADLALDVGNVEEAWRSVQCTDILSVCRNIRYIRTVGIGRRTI